MITLDVVSDLVCPWCFIGLRRLDKAMAEVRRAQPKKVVAIRWRPFFLNPDTPPEGEPYLPFLERKFGNRAAVEALFDRVRAAGHSAGVDFAFERIERRANTLMAHCLIHWAQGLPAVESEAFESSATTGGLGVSSVAALVERLFEAQFQRGEPVGDLDLLAAIATECGYDGGVARQRLVARLDVEAVRAAEAAARQSGITMIPSFIVGGQTLIVGAEDPSVLAAAILEAA